MNVISFPKNIQHTCKICNSVLEIAIKDVIINDVGHPAAEYVICPVCKSVRDLAGELPKEWILILYRNECGH